MTDTFRPTATLPGQDTQPLRVHAAGPVADYAQFAPHHVDGIEEDDGQINCICGFNEDDGNTVACDSCNKWQHIICYYPEYGDSLPDELQHDCVECRPNKPVNRQAAYNRQREARAQRHAVQNGVKKPPAKSHKKKVKDAPLAGHTNGWPMDKSRHDRNSASPRDLQPPAKRPKTSHRASNSTVKDVSRKRNGSTAQHRRSLSRSPDPPLPIPLYTPEFIRAHQDDYQIPDTNVMSIPIYDSMNRWIMNPDEVFDLTGLELSQIVQRYDGDLSVLQGPPSLEVQEVSDSRYTSADGKVAAWKYMTLSEPLVKDACIGELRGRLEFKEEYTAEPANRWSTLRHPEPFVFLHPHLPICIDARHEGTAVRYIRRSCKPNAELRVIITGKADYHFCFIALRDILPGEEIAVSWDINSTLWETYRRGLNGVPTEHMPVMWQWVSTVLSNCGPCACGKSAAECLMARMDKRDPNLGPNDEPSKMRKPNGKRKKAGQYISPLNTHAVNSRSGSEARKAEQDDEPTDSRSASGSGRGSASRDITPNTHYSANGTTEMSERERKKLAKVEELFSKQEEEGSGRQAKKKRSSAGGSALNTPNPTSSKQLGLPNTGASKQPGPPSSKNSSGRRSKGPTSSKPSAKSAGKARKPKPVYVESSTQCDMSEEEEEERKRTRPTLQRQYITVQQRLEEHCARMNSIWRSQQARLRRPAPVEKVVEKKEIEAEAPAPASPKVEAQDVDMEDALEETAVLTPTPEPAPPKSPHVNSSPRAPPSPASAHPPADPPAPPWPGKDAVKPTIALPESGSPNFSSKEKDKPDKGITTDGNGETDKPPPPQMHLTMPPPPTNPFAASQQNSQPTPSSAAHTLTGALAQSPASLITPNAPVFSPSVAAAVNPSPARKKLSLSDYTRRSKAKDHKEGGDAGGSKAGAGGGEKEGRDSSPASAVSGREEGGAGTG